MSSTVVVNGRGGRGASCANDEGEEKSKARASAIEIRTSSTAFRCVPGGIPTAAGNTTSLSYSVKTIFNPRLVIFFGWKQSHNGPQRAAGFALGKKLDA